MAFSSSPSGTRRWFPKRIVRVADRSKLRAKGFLARLFLEPLEERILLAGQPTLAFLTLGQTFSRGQAGHPHRRIAGSERQS